MCIYSFYGSVLNSHFNEDSLLNVKLEGADISPNTYAKNIQVKACSHYVEHRSELGFFKYRIYILCFKMYKLRAKIAAV